MSRFVNKLTRVAPIQLPRFFYTGVHVSDLERAVEFYTKQLRMKLLFKARIKETGGRVAWLKSKGSSQLLELNWYPKGYKYGGKSGLDHLAFKVKDVRSLYNQITKKHSHALEPFSEGRWKLAYVKDPDGNWIELGELVRKSKRRA